MPRSESLKRTLVLAYGISCYAMFLGVFLYAIGFIGNLFTPTSLDGDPMQPIGRAVLINLSLLTAFALQHSVMARPAFKRWWIRFVSQPVERSTYVLFSNIAMIAMFACWQPMGGTVWQLENATLRAVVYSIYGLGWITVLYATCLIHHFDLFGVRQTWLYFRGRDYSQLEFRVPSLYRHVRHPLYVGWLTVFWAAPTMTAAHLMFAVVTTAYILVAIFFEERDLVKVHGESYTEYRQTTPMLIPRLGRVTQFVSLNDEEQDRSSDKEERARPVAVVK